MLDVAVSARLAKNVEVRSAWRDLWGRLRREDAEDTVAFASRPGMSGGFEEGSGASTEGGGGAIPSITSVFGLGTGSVGSAGPAGGVGQAGEAGSEDQGRSLTYIGTAVSALAALLKGLRGALTDDRAG